MDLGKMLGGLLGGATGGTGNSGGSSAGGGLGGLLGGTLGGSGGLGSIASVVLGMLGGGAGAAGGLGGLSGLLGKLTQGGLGDTANSWVSPGENQPVDPSALASALGPDTISHVAEQAGVSRDEAAAGLAQILPHVVDHLTPDGQVPDDASVQGSLGSLLGPSGS